MCSPATTPRRCRARRSWKGSGARGIEVLLLTDPIDAFWPERMDEFEGKPIRSVTQGAADLSKLERCRGRHLARPPT